MNRQGQRNSLRQASADGSGSASKRLAAGPGQQHQGGSGVRVPACVRCACPRACACVCRAYWGRMMSQKILGTRSASVVTGILSWALDGLDRLTRQGRFTEPKSSLDSILALQDLVSPKAAFVRDCCEVGIGYEISVAGLFDAWKVWAEINGHRPGTVQTFGRDIRAVVPSLRQARPRDGEDRERRYVGIPLKSTGHDGGDRGPVWTTGQNSAHNWQNSAPVRDGPQPNPLWGEGPRRPGMPNLGECSVCGGPMWIVEPGQRTHPNCDPGETDQRARR
jgi:putative DNA primase/helicase